MATAYLSTRRIAVLLLPLIWLPIDAQADQPAAAVPVDTYCPNLKEVLASRTFSEAFIRAALRARAAEGEAAVSFTVTTDNRIADITPSEASHPAFAEAAVSTVRRLKCDGGGTELHLKIPLAFNLESSSYSPDPDDIPSEDLPQVVPLISELRTDRTRFVLKPGEGLKISSLKVLAFDAHGKFLGRLRQSDRDAQPRNVLVFRGADIVQAKESGSGYLEVSAPQWSKYGAGRDRPTLRIEISVAE